MKIDCFAHICPQKFIDAFNKKGGNWEIAGGKAAVQVAGPALWDIDKRLKVMGRHEDYMQLLVPGIELVEAYFGPDDSPGLVRLFNDEVAEVISKYPDKFAGAVATIPMNNIDAALKEIDRAINELGFKGIIMHIPVFSYEKDRPLEKGLNYETQKTLDSPEFMPIFESMSRHNLPIWLHPFGMGGAPIYNGEQRGRYQLFLAIGWPVESAMAMSRLVCCGVLDKYPNLKFIIHHCGSGIIPVLGERIAFQLERAAKTGVAKWDRPEDNPFTNKPAIDYFKMFYGDTALDGSVAGLECGHEFFGAEHMVFGTDFPFDAASGDIFIKKAVDAVHKMRISDADKELIFEGNAKRILQLDI